MIRGLFWLGAIAVIAVLGATVPLGKRTLFGHISAIWESKEATEMRDGIGEKAGPALERVKRGVAAGVEAAKDEGSAAGSGVKAATGSDARPAPR